MASCAQLEQDAKRKVIGVRLRRNSPFTLSVMGGKVETHCDICMPIHPKCGFPSRHVKEVCVPIQNRAGLFLFVNYRDPSIAAATLPFNFVSRVEIAGCLWMLNKRGGLLYELAVEQGLCIPRKGGIGAAELISNYPVKQFIQAVSVLFGGKLKTR